MRNYIVDLYLNITLTKLLKLQNCEQLILHHFFLRCASFWDSSWPHGGETKVVWRHQGNWKSTSTSIEDSLSIGIYSSYLFLFFVGCIRTSIFLHCYVYLQCLHGDMYILINDCYLLIFSCFMYSYILRWHNCLSESFLDFLNCDLQFFRYLGLPKTSEHDSFLGNLGIPIMYHCGFWPSDGPSLPL